MLAPQTTVLHHPSKDSKPKIPTYLKPTSTCGNGHDKTRYNRADGKCGGCHYERQLRYYQTERGRAIRSYMRMKNKLRRKIKDTQARIAELEREQ